MKKCTLSLALLLSLSSINSFASEDNFDQIVSGTYETNATCNGERFAEITIKKRRHRLITSVYGALAVFDCPKNRSNICEEETDGSSAYFSKIEMFDDGSFTITNPSVNAGPCDGPTRYVIIPISASTSDQPQLTKMDHLADVVSNLKSIIDHIGNISVKIESNVPIPRYLGEDGFDLFIGKVVDYYPCINMSADQLYHADVRDHTILEYAQLIRAMCVESIGANLNPD